MRGNSQSTVTFLSVDDDGQLRPNAPRAWANVLLITRLWVWLITASLLVVAVALAFWASQHSVVSLDPMGWFAWFLALLALGAASWVSLLITAMALGAIAAMLASTSVIHPYPARMLILRPFGDASLASGLRKLVKRKLGKRGYCLTLVDEAYLMNRSTREFLGAFPATAILALIQPRLAPGHPVRSERQLDAMRRRLNKRTGFSLPALWAQDNPIQIVSSDAMWQEVVAEFFHACDLVLMDLSVVKQGSEWEIGQLAQRAMLASTIFVCSRDATAEAIVKMKEIGAQTPLYIYDRAGVICDTWNATGDATSNAESAFDGHAEMTLRSTIGA